LVDNSSGADFEAAKKFEDFCLSIRRHKTASAGRWTLLEAKAK
jgi:hypothetical protein